MSLHVLPFAKIIILREDIAEVIINDTVELTLEMVNDYHAFLLSHLSPPFSLLINKINSYSYTYNAQKELATLKEINAMAVVVYRRATKISTETLVAVPRTEPWNLKIYSNRNDALEWLIATQDRLAAVKR